MEPKLAVLKPLSADRGPQPPVGRCRRRARVTVLVLERSILTEKVARRGYHVSREYEIDPLEALFVRDVVDISAPPTPPPARPLPPAMRAHLDDTLRAVTYRMASSDVTILPVLDDTGYFRGEIALADILKARRRHLEQETRRERVIPIHRLLPSFMRPPPPDRPSSTHRSGPR